MKKSTWDEFVAKAKNIHGDKYDYSKFEYVNTRTYGIILCSKHDEFVQKAATHLRGRGCPSCGNSGVPHKNQVRNREQFVKKANEVHNFKYNYFEFEYVSTRANGKIICPVHGEFYQIAGEHLRGCGCSDCGGSKRKTIEEFIIRANKIHNNKYDYSKFEYVNHITRGIIICPEHGEFEQIPINHWGGSGCPKCGIIRVIEKNSKDVNEFIKQASQVHENKYDYSKSIYKGIFEVVTIVCPDHGEFEQKPCHHLCGAGCQICGRIEANNKLTKSIDEFVKQARLVHGDKYDYSESEYVHSFKKIIITCPTHGKFWQAPSNHLNGGGCLSCSRNSVSKVSQSWLDSIGVPNEYREKVVTINQTKYILDALDPKTKTAYEFYGDYWHGNPEKYFRNAINKKKGKSFGELYDDTIKREIILKSAGYTVISIWESEFISSLDI